MIENRKRLAIGDLAHLSASALVQKSLQRFQCLQTFGLKTLPKMLALTAFSGTSQQFFDLQPIFQIRGCQGSQKRGLLSGRSGELLGKSGSFREVWETSGEPLDTVREIPGKSPRNFRGGVRGNSVESSWELDSFPATRQNCLQILEVLRLEWVG